MDETPCADHGDEVLLQLLDRRGTILGVNPAWSAALGCAAADAAGQPAVAFVDPGHADAFSAFLANLDDPAASPFLHVVLRDANRRAISAVVSARVLPSEESGGIACEIWTVDGLARAIDRSRRQAARDRAEATVMRTVSAVTDILARNRTTPDFLRDLGALLEAASGTGRVYIETTDSVAAWMVPLRGRLGAEGGMRKSGGTIFSPVQLAGISPHLVDVFGERPVMVLWLADADAADGRRHIVAALSKDAAILDSWTRHIDGFAHALANALSCLHAWEQQALMLRKAHTQSVTDPLTRIFNRYKLEETLREEERRAGRYGTWFSVILADIDHFKAVNDSYGHPTGDAVLQEIAAELRDHVRTTDVLGRWGGEEFLIVCIHTGLEVAVGLAELLRRRIAQRRFADIGGLTVSFGVAAFVPGDTADAVVARADAALYAAKRGGRNRVSDAPPEAQARA